MGRNKKHRRCRFLNEKKVFKPIGIPITDLPTIEIETDEFEAMRLCDIENKNQIEAAEAMKISRGTIQRLLQSGRYKLTRAILNNNAIIIKNNI
ncbi:MAG: hypothetical protein CVV23_08775 [Ignavibacteriae bacterium HGW-Ignavibacteriae-2]|jgi:predicted DNA-binding protein (UPF0251 family)|nr:MAG: hypothetical protein CVV23_08775 [Ignavibacteriae bacterium HGW-Ignavibacteriae-2]